MIPWRVTFRHSVRAVTFDVEGATAIDAVRDAAPRFRERFGYWPSRPLAVVAR